MKKNQGLIQDLLHLKGNPRACVYTEPLWGIPNSLYMPYVSLYMLSIGLSEAQIGLTVSIGLFFQIISALLSGPITDKLGRKRTTLIFDILSWSIPCLIWVFAQSFWYFLAAGIINSLYRITANSWTCLLVEDAEQRDLVSIFSWVHIAALLSAFFAPLAGILIAKMTLVPAVRLLYVLAFILMTTKFIILNVFASETEHGKKRMEATKDVSILFLLKQYRTVFRQLFSTPVTIMTLGLFIVMSISMMINDTFWAVLVTRRLNISESVIALFPSLRSGIMLLFFFVIIPKIKQSYFKSPMLIGFLFFAAAQILLITIPEKNLLLLSTATVLEACGLSLLRPFLDSLMIIMIDPHERARIQAIIYVAAIAVTTPFGWIAGLLSEANKTLPFVLNLFLLTIGITLIFQLEKQERLQKKA